MAKRSFHKELVLNQWIMRFFKGGTLNALKYRLGEDRHEGLEDDGQTGFFHELQQNCFELDRITEKDLRPVVAISDLRAPLLVASGTEDQHTPWPETERIFAAGNQPKELWAVQGAAHVDLYSYDPVAYKTRILKFLAKHLRNES